MPGPAYRAVILAGLAVTATALLAGCGGAGSGRDEPPRSLQDVLAEVEGLSGAARTEKLLELAEEEGGELSLYSSSATDQIADIANAFEDAHGIDVSLYRTRSNLLLERLEAEEEAGFRGADVVESSDVFQVPAGYLTPYDSPLRANLVAEAVTHDEWTADRFNQRVVIWNTKNVSPEERPRSFEDLADPRWKGTLGLDPRDVDWYMTLWNYFVDSGMEPAEVDRLFEGIGRNSVIVDGSAFRQQLVSSGELDVSAANNLHTLLARIERGEPLGYEPVVEPVVMAPVGVGIMGSARHPAGAALFVDWILGEGQEALKELYMTPVRKDLAPPASLAQAPTDVDRFLAEEEEWEKRFDEIVRLGTKGPEEDE